MGLWALCNVAGHMWSVPAVKSILSFFPLNLWVKFIKVVAHYLLKSSAPFSYREAFEALKRAQISCTEREEDVLDGYEELDRFNQHIVDIADTIWRNKAFEERFKSLCYSIPR